MTGKIIRLDERRNLDPHSDYYDLSLEQRFAAYNLWVWKTAYDHRECVLKDLGNADSGDKRPTAKDLTDELKKIIPSFTGTVLRRDYNAWPSYVLTTGDMRSLFGESLFGKVTGKVVVESDNLLSPDHQDLAGYVILIEEQENEEKEGFIASHEGEHAGNSRYPNALRRDQYYSALKQGKFLSSEQAVQTIIGLDEAIQIDEAGAVIDSYRWLECRTWKPWKPGRNDETYDVSLIKSWWDRFGRDFIGELKESSRNMLGFQLSSFRASGNLNTKVIDNINQHERNSMKFPLIMKQTTERLANKLQNPESLEPLSYAMSYITESLQIVDYSEIIDGTLESFCADVLEPHRLGRGGFGQAFTQFLAEKNKD